MLIQVLAFGAILGASTASTVYMEDVDISLNSKIGNKLFSKARRLNDNNDDGVDFTWVMDYSLKFDSCHKTIEFRADGKSGDEEDGSPYEHQQWVQFKLCPSDSCGWCRRSGDYLVEMRDFLEAYSDFQTAQKEYNCEQLKNNCACDDDQDDQNCFAQCYMNAGLDYCAEFESGDGNDDGNDDNFDLEEYMECKEVGDNDDDSTVLYVGPTCSSNGKNIYLGAFSDRDCSRSATGGAYKALTGKSLPFTSTSLVSNDCISCLEPANNDDDNNGDGIREFCEELYNDASKCEKNLKGVDYKMNGGCEYIHKMLPQAERMANRSVSKSTVFAWLFFVSTSAVSLYAVLLYRRLKRTQVSLAEQGYGVTA